MAITFGLSPQLVPLLWRQARASPISNPLHSLRFQQRHAVSEPYSLSLQKERDHGQSQGREEELSSAHSWFTQTILLVGQSFH